MCRATERSALGAQNDAMDSMVSYTQKKCTDEELRKGHLYQSTYVSGGTNFQGDVYGQIHIHQSSSLYQDGRAGTRNLLESCESMNSGFPVPSELHNGQASEDKIQNCLSRIIDLSTGIADSLGSTQAKDCIRNLTTLLTNISICDKYTPNESSQLYLSELLDRTASILKLSAGLRMYPVQSQHVSMLSCSSDLSHKSAIRRRNSFHDLQYRNNCDEESLAP